MSGFFAASGVFVMVVGLVAAEGQSPPLVRRNPVAASELRHSVVEIVEVLPGPP